MMFHLWFYVLGGVPPLSCYPAPRLILSCLLSCVLGFLLTFVCVPFGFVYIDGVRFMHTYRYAASFCVYSGYIHTCILGTALTMRHAFCHSFLTCVPLLIFVLTHVMFHVPTMLSMVYGWLMSTIVSPVYLCNPGLTV